MQAQHESADNCALKEETDIVFVAIRKSIKHAICPNGDAPPHEDLL